VIKPTEVTPLTSVLLVRLAEEAGVPAGVVNILLGTGPAVGAPLSEHPDVDMVSFTGGLGTGQAIIRASAATVKRVAVELGARTRTSCSPTPSTHSTSRRSSTTR
jgi:betaine-aldehyde dehydrogenase